ncbi:7822_t:CDS:2 [Funneliformis caledonium]|uniref:7822_t:CDS:1 n=1 Tax=Funneliformis caledonium TaxID=1117310 RepID=A0A9N9H3Y1_9GLOM|nr:7822_t:CDS:2 [Funneliformis caledonium]
MLEINVKDITKNKRSAKNQIQENDDFKTAREAIKTFKPSLINSNITNKPLDHQLHHNTLEISI